MSKLDTGRCENTHLADLEGGLQGKVNQLVDDISILKPTMLFAVPRVWTRIMDNASRKIDERGAFVKCAQDCQAGF